MKDTLKNKLIGEQLSSVEFVQDYVQFHFDGRTITAYVWPEVIFGKEAFSFGQESYRNKLCDLIGLEIKDLHYQEKDFLILIFKNTDGVIRLNLDPKNPDVISEVAIFNDDLDKTWSVFD